MSDRTAVLLLRSAAVVGGALALVGLVLIIATGDADVLLSEGGAFAAFALFFAVIVWLVAPRQPRNPLVAIMAAVALFGSTYNAGWAFASLLEGDLVYEAATIPAELSPAAAWILAITVPLGSGAFLVLLTFGLLLFPDGTLPSSRWRWAAALAGVGVALLTSGLAWGFRPSNTSDAEEGPLLIFGGLVFMVAAVVSLAALASRFRHSRGVEREQLKWVVWGATILILSLLALLIVEESRYEPVALPVFALAAVVWVVSYGIAVGRYRLFDIDLVINKTVVFGVLAAFITAMYVGIVVGIGAILGREGEVSFALSVTATVLVAIAFQPVRRRVQRWANRLVYGERATPYEILARFSAGATQTGDEELIGQLPRLIVDGTGASEAILWIHTGDAFQPSASWPESVDRKYLAGTDGLFHDPQADFSLPIFHDDDLLGGISLVKGRGETITPAEEELLSSLASGMGLALRNVRLTSRLREQVASLEASRERVLAAADDARRALELDLDRGPQQQLVALKVKLGPTRLLAEQAGAAKTSQVIAQLEEDTGDAIRAVRDFASGIYPPLLEAEGLATAITQQAQGAPFPVALEAAGIGRYPREIEAAAYFSVLEALQNAVKYSDAGTVRIVLLEDEGTLVFEVSDDGRGFDDSSFQAGAGLANMADRVDALSGSLDVQSSPGEGTLVRGTLPLQALEPVEA